MVSFAVILTAWLNKWVNRMCDKNMSCLGQPTAQSGRFRESHEVQLKMACELISCLTISFSVEEMTETKPMAVRQGICKPALRSMQIAGPI